MDNTSNEIKEQLRKVGGADAPEFSLNGKKLYGRVVNVYDGDTITVVLKIFDNFYKFHVRLSGIDTCEIKSKCEENKKLAIKARNRVLSIVCNKTLEDIEERKLDSRKKINDFLEKEVTIVSVDCQEFDKYGRLLANVYAENSADHLSSILLNERLAYKYGGDTKLTEDQIRDYLGKSC